MKNALRVVQRQLEAYNARDLDAFVANFSDSISVFHPPKAEPVLAGKAAFIEFYATQRFNRPGLKAEVVNRMAFESKVVDHERITGVGERAIELVVVYSVVGGLIDTMWAFPAD